MSPHVSVIFPTRNRRELLARAIAAAMRQTVPVEVIVLDDDSNDGTGNMIRTDFPSVRYERFDGPKGPSFLRNRGADLATGDILFPLDDDAEMISPETIEQTLTEFDKPCIAAVGIPYINVRVSPDVLQRSPRGQRLVTSAFVGASHAVRKDVFQRVGGFREHLFYMGEESDLCIRMLAAGYVTVMGHADPIHHHESPLRNTRWSGLYGRRNDILFAWQNVPALDLPLRFVRATTGGIAHGVKRRKLLRAIEGVLWGYASVFRYFFKRSAVSRETYRLFRQLSIAPQPLNEIRTLLPPTG